MSREIKFRAWSKYIKSFAYFTVFDGDNSHLDWAETIEQYTGLKDKNGVEIYEGDVFKTSWDEIRIVEDYNDFIYRVLYSESHSGLGGSSQKDIEVIGNIHETK